MHGKFTKTTGKPENEMREYYEGSKRWVPEQWQAMLMDKGVPAEVVYNMLRDAQRVSGGVRVATAFRAQFLNKEYRHAMRDVFKGAGMAYGPRDEIAETYTHPTPEQKAAVSEMVRAIFHRGGAAE